MKVSISKLLRPMALTLILLVILEIVSATIFPLLGIINYQIPFNILIVLYLCFKLDGPYVAVLILIIQYFHSLFSIEGWALGTIIGVVVSRIVYLFREAVQFFSFPIVIVVVEASLILWFILSSLFIYFQRNSFGPILDKFWIFIPESIMASMIAPLLFFVLERIWKQEEAQLQGVG